MTWAEWLRALFTFETIRRRQIDDLKLGAYFTATLMRQRKMPTLRAWLIERKSRSVVGAERDRLRAERKYVDEELDDLLKSRKVNHGNQRSTRTGVHRNSRQSRQSR